MPTDSEMRSWRDSWPPTQVRLEQPGAKHNDEPLPLLEDIDEDPLTYFLTPTSPQENEDGDYYAMDLDAGIEDPNNPHEMVRSVSPSALDGLRKSNQDRASSPECDSDMTSHDDDDEDYVRFSPTGSRLTSFRDLDTDGPGHRAQSPVFGRSVNALLSPASFPTPQPRGWNSVASRRARARSMSIRSRPNHIWREPSPDVWSIEEETEEELTSEMANSMDGKSDGGGEKNRDDERVEKKAAKPKKKVRFVLPAKEA